MAEYGQGSERPGLIPSLLQLALCLDTLALTLSPCQIRTSLWVECLVQCVRKAEERCVKTPDKGPCSWRTRPSGAEGKELTPHTHRTQGSGRPLTVSDGVLVPAASDVSW